MGRKTGGGFYSRGALYKFLRNHLYIGEIEHKGSIYLGEHEALLDRRLWEQVQQLLDKNRQGTRTRRRAISGSILTGLLFSESGVRYIPTSAHKRGRRYHYYTSQAPDQRRQKDGSIGRLPGPVLESAVAERILKFLKSPTEILNGVEQLEASDVNCDKILENARQRASHWPAQAGSSATAGSTLHRAGRPSLRPLLRARSWYELIVADKATGLADLARQHGLTHCYVKNLFPLACLSPQSIELLLSCRNGQPRTLESLKGKVPIRWDAQISHFADPQ